MKPAPRATMSTLLIAVTRPRNSPVSVTWRLATGITETAGGGGVTWAMAAPQQTSSASAPMAAGQPRHVSRPGIKALSRQQGDATLHHFAPECHRLVDVARVRRRARRGNACVTRQSA